jgi:hypothetical protein
MLGKKKTPARPFSIVRNVIVPITRKSRNEKRPLRQQEIRRDKDPINRSYDKINGDGIDWSNVRG